MPRMSTPAADELADQLEHTAALVRTIVSALKREATPTSLDAARLLSADVDDVLFSLAERLRTGEEGSRPPAGT